MLPCSPLKSVILQFEAAEINSKQFLNGRRDNGIAGITCELYR